MLNSRRNGKINVKVLVILIIITAAIISALFAARQIRRNILSKISLERGQQAFESKDWVNAYKNFQEYLGRNPDNIEILKKYAEARMSVRPLEAGDLSGGIIAYRRILQLDSNDKNVYDKLAKIYASIGNYDELAYIAEKRLRNNPDDKDAPLWLADAKINTNKFADANETLNKLIHDIELLPDKYPQYVQACLMMSNIVISLDNSSSAAIKALEWYNKAVNYSPDSVEALVNRAKYYLEMPSIPGVSINDRLSVARSDLELADKLKSENPEVLFLLCFQWLGMEEYDKAAMEIQRAEKLPEETIKEYYFDIQDFKTKVSLLVSEIAIKQGDNDKALSEIDKSLKSFTEEQNRFLLLPTAIKIYTIEGKISDANSYLDEYLKNAYKFKDAISLEKESAYLKSIVALAQGKPYLVIDILEPVVAKSNSPEMLRILAQAYGKTNQLRRSVACIEQYLIYFPKDIEVKKLLAKEYFSLGQLNLSFEAAKEVASLDPNDLVSQIIYFESGIRLAIEEKDGPDKNALEGYSSELNKLRLKYPKNAEIRILQAVIAENLGQSENAVEELLQQAISDCNETLNAEMQLAKIYRKNKQKANAINILKKASQQHPDSARPCLALSEIYLEDANDANVELARNCLKQGLDTVTSQEGRYSLSIKLALLELLKGDRNTGINALKAVAEQYKQDIEVRLMLLEIKEIQDDPTQTQEYVNQLHEIEGQDGLWWRLSQARVWLDSKQWSSKQDDISEMLQNCISADPGWTKPVLLLVELYKKEGDLKRAEDICKQALARNPLAADVANQLLLILESQGRYADAEKILQQSEADQKFLNSWQIRMAFNTGNTQDISKAIDELKLRISNNKDDAFSRIQLASLIYRQSKDIVQAFKYLDEAQAIAPDSIYIPVTKAALLKEDGQGEEAIKVINQYVDTHNTFDAYYIRALNYTNEGENELAEKDYRKLTTFEDRGSVGYELLSNFFAGNKQYDKAISATEEGLVKYPDNVSLEDNLMRLLAIQGPTRNIEKASEILAKLEEKLPQDSELIKFKAALLMENKTQESRDTAKDLLDNLIKQQPTDIDSYLMLISIALEEEKYDIARNYANQALRISPDNPMLMAARSRIELESGNLQKAAELSKLILGTYPNNPDARNVFIRAAIISRDKSLAKDALNLVESALESNPKDENMLINKTNILMVLDQANIAVPEMEAYCQVEPGKSSIPALMTLGDLYRITGNMDKAEKIIVQAQSMDPNNLSIINSLFLIRVSQKQYDELSQMVDSYLSADANDVQLILNAATLLLTLNSQELRDDGVKLFEHAYAVEPNSVDTGFSLASALYRTGNSERAEQIYSELLEKFPNDSRVLNDYAWILQDKHQDYDKALELVNKGIRLSPNDLHILDTRGTILLKSGKQLEQAKKDFEKIIELTPAGSRQQAKAFLNLGRISLKLNDNVEAKKYYQNAQEINQKLNIFTPAELTEVQENIK